MKKTFSLPTKIMIGMILGIIVGLLFLDNPDIPNNYIKPFGTLFLNLIKFIIVPIVLFSLISGVISISDVRKVGSIGIKTIAFYLFTTFFAIILGLIFANIFNVGGSGQFATEGLEFTTAEAPSIMDSLINIFPSNAVAPMLNASMLQVIVIALFFGFGIIISGDNGKPFANFVESANVVSLNVMSIIIKLSPIGVFALICPVVATNGPTILGSLFKLIVVTYLVYIIHMVGVYSVLLKVFNGMSPLKFFKGMMPAMVMAFSSCSGMCALPLNLECYEKLGGKKEISSFVLPLGATINMDGTAIYQGVAAIFIAQVFGIDLTISQMLTIVLTATLASIGTAGVPGAGMIMLAMVLQSVSLPIEGIALIAGVDRILDMGRTTLNITGDAVCSFCIETLEEKKEKRKAMSGNK